MKFLLSCFSSILLAGSVLAGEFEARTFEAPGLQKLPYRLLQPPKREGKPEKVPLVILLHGAGERGSDNSAQLKYGASLFKDSSEKYPRYVMVPQCPSEQKWVDLDWSKPEVTQPAEPSAPMKGVIATMEALQKEFPDIDADRLYVTGLSMGGYGTWDLLTRFPGIFAAGAPICGGGDPAKANVLTQTAIWNFHGDKDNAVSVEKSRSMIAAIEKAGGHPLYSEYPNVGHGSWDNAFKEPELLPWLFAQKRGRMPLSFSETAAPFAQPPSNQFPGTGPIQEGIWFRPLWQSRRAEWAKSAPADQGALVFLGDSITQGWSSLGAGFAPRKVANRGISGDTTRGVLGRLKDVTDLHPRAVSILIGTNDIGLGATPEMVAANYQQIIAALHKEAPKMPVIVCLVMPSTGAKSRPADKLKALNALLSSAVAGDEMVKLVDTYSLFANEAGDAKLEEFPDLLHPNAAGYAKWKSALDPILAQIGL